MARFGGVAVGLVAAAAASCSSPPVEYADLVLRKGAGTARAELDAATRKRLRALGYAVEAEEHPAR